MPQVAQVALVAAMDSPHQSTRGIHHHHSSVGVGVVVVEAVLEVKAVAAETEGWACSRSTLAQ